MTTQFELSAYGVEEMNKKEMIETDGGAIWAWVFRTIAYFSIGEIVSVVADWMMVDPETNKVLENQPKIFRQQEIKVHGLDIRVTKDGLSFTLDSLIIRN